ncbi:MAG: hypothetical protein C4K58_05635 [Flavobacteriaceae bacterium]|nr:MAG: hypothetical protein C4K58_05635 [Flavobacteriaceae bacterium]
MKKILILSFLSLLGLSFLSFSPSNSSITEKTTATIDFKVLTLEKALVLSKKENKPLFVYVHASWCAPCVRLKSTTFADEKVIEYFNQNFINVSFDVDKPISKTMVQKYKVRSVPSLYVFSPAAKTLANSEGYLNATQILQWAKSGLNKK